jgi:hypothetical protein
MAGLRHPAADEILVAVLAGDAGVFDGAACRAFTPLTLGARGPVNESGVGAFAGTPDCCLERAFQRRLTREAPADGDLR